MKITRRAAVFGAIAAGSATAAEAADDPASTVRDLLRRAQRGQTLPELVAAPDAAAYFTADLLARLTNIDVPALFPGLRPLGGPGDDEAPPRLLAMRTLRRRRDTALVVATLRPRGRGRRPWTTAFALRHENRRWRIDDLWIESDERTLRERAAI